MYACPLAADREGGRFVTAATEPDDPMTATIPGPPASVDDADASTYLKPYVPRLVIDWLRHTPDAMHREVEATLVFVDISGFTALTERLARKGKVGSGGCGGESVTAYMRTGGCRNSRWLH